MMVVVESDDAIAGDESLQTGYYYSIPESLICEKRKGDSWTRISEDKLSALPLAPLARG